MTIYAASEIPIGSKNGVVVVAGYGIRVTVYRRHLTVSDGIGRDRRFARFSRATSGLRRLVILGHSGTISLDSLLWLHNIGCGLIQIDNGELISAFGPVGLDNARLRRAQAQAMRSRTGLTVARKILQEKLRGEEAILVKLPRANSALNIVRSALAELANANSLDALLMVEARAAAAYWSAWADLPVIFASKDLDRIPDYWRNFGQRGSPLTGSPRTAANPANAILNYLYAILEAETRIACLAMGLDPGVGILHADQRARDSMVLDIMEAGRPQVDAFVLKLLKVRVFRAADFHETPRGQCRVLPPLTHVLAETAPIWEKRVAPIVERVAKMLADSSPRVVRITTPLTQSNRSAGRAPFKRVIGSPQKPNEPRVRKTCQMCGNDLASRRRSYCDECVKEFEREKLPRLLAAGASAIARLAAQGRDPAHGGEAARKRGSSNRRRMQEAREWNRLHQGLTDSGKFKEEILPKLREVPVKRIMKGTGLSLRYCSLIRRGLYVPYPRHWERLLKVIEGVTLSIKDLGEEHN